MLDPTANVKLDELTQAFSTAGGESYIGQAAWEHLTSVAGTTMAHFINIYVHRPLEELLREAPHDLPDLTLRMRHNQIILEIGREYLTIQRGKLEEVTSDEDQLPEDIDEDSPIV